MGEAKDDVERWGTVCPACYTSDSPRQRTSLEHHEMYFSTLASCIEVDVLRVYQNYFEQVADCKLMKDTIKAYEENAASKRKICKTIDEMLKERAQRRRAQYGI